MFLIDHWPSCLDKFLFLTTNPYFLKLAPLTNTNISNSLYRDGVGSNLSITLVRNSEMPNLILEVI